MYINNIPLLLHELTSFSHTKDNIYMKKNIPTDNIRYIFLMLLLALSSAINAQTLNGTVIDANTQEPIVGAAVSIKDGKTTTTGAITDIDGKFSINVKHTPSTLIVNFTGYKPTEVELYEVTDESVTIELSEDFNHLNEVVVVGYGKQERAQLTGSVASVKADVFAKAVTPTFDEALGGKVAGLNITATSGQPGAASQVRIRGGNSVNASNEPLYVIDGFIYYKDAAASKTGLGALESSLNPLASINPSDIESVEVLKDVSATAIYGSRGANGVIIVTTKKGKTGKTSINYRYTIGFDAITKKLDLLGARDWAKLQKEHFFNKGGYTDEQIEALGKGTDWQDAVLQTGTRQSHEFSVSGGSEKIHYAVSANYTDQNGIVISSGFRRYNFHINSDYELAHNLILGVNASFGKSTQRGLSTTESVAYNSSPYSAGITNSLVYALFMPPVVPVYNTDGSYNYKNPYEYAYFAIGDKTANPVSDLRNSVAESINNYLISNFYLQYRWHDFTVKAALGLNREHITQNYFSPSYTALGLANNGIGGIGNKQNEIWQQEYTLNYNHKFGIHQIDALAGYTHQRSTTNYNSILASHFTNETLKQNNLADASYVYPPASGNSNSILQSLIARVNYTLLDRYNITATFRADKSSRFSSGNEWGYFPSIGISWNIDKEAFFHQNKILNTLKLRASVGSVGNQEIGDYEYAQAYAASRYNGSSSYTKKNLDNPNLKWETTTSGNVGFDAGLFNNRLNIVFDAYYKKTSNLLLLVPIGSSFSGVNKQLQNVGNVVNKGIEISVNGILIHKRKVDWSVTGNIAFNRNRIIGMGTSNNIIQGNQNETVLRKGEALGSFYGLVFKGIGANGEELFIDQDNNNIINGNDRVVLGSVQPKFTYGLSSTLQWNDFDASISFQGSAGNKLFNSLRRNLEYATDAYNVLTDYYTSSRSMSYIDSRYVESASYLKLKNLTLGYRVHPRTLPLSVRLFFTASNLFTITPYKGYDPEVASGTDNGAYPSARSFVFGIDVNF